MIYLIAIALIPLSVLALVARHHTAKHGVMPTVGRVALGIHPSGYRHTNRSFWRDSDGTVRGQPPYTVKRKHHRAEYKNLLRTCGLVTGLVALAYGMTADLVVTVGAAAVGIAALVVWHAVRGYRKARTAWRNRTVIRPLSHALAVVPGTTAAEIEKGIYLEPNYLTIKRGEIGRVAFPDNFHAASAERETVEHLIQRRLPVNVDFTWHTTKRPQHITINAVPPMPGVIPLVKILPDLAALPKDKILLGVTGNDDHRTWDMASEEPMMFVSATSRRGKTTLAMFMMAQILNQGGSVVAIDPKAIGLDEFCAGHPNAKVYADITDIESLWQGVKDFRGVLNQRIADFKEDRTLTFKRLTLFLDEVSVFNSISQAHWDATKPSKSRAVPPVWNDIMAIVFQGAQFGVNCCIFGQRVDFRTLGGLIDGFGTRLLAGYNKATYMRLVGELPVPKSQKPRGRFLLFGNGDAYPTWVQVPYGSIQEMRDYAFEPVTNARQATVPGVPAIIQGEVST